MVLLTERCIQSISKGAKATQRQVGRDSLPPGAPRHSAVPLLSVSTQSILVGWLWVRTRNFCKGFTAIARESGQDDLEQHPKARSKEPDCWSRGTGWPAKAAQSRRETGV